MTTWLAYNAVHPEKRVAMVENGTLAELYVERASERSMVGNLYKGRVVRVLPVAISIDPN